MPYIASPPAFDELLGNHEDNLPAILRVAMPGSGRQPYLHWNKLRRRPPPSGLSHEQWWLSLKIWRRGHFLTLPFKDINGLPFRYVHTERVAEVLHEIDVWGGTRAYRGMDAATEEHRDRFILNSLIQEAISSSQLEGASTTRQVAEEMIRHKRRPQGRHEKMILNNYRAMKEVRTLAQHSLKLEDLLHLHRIVTEDTLKNPHAAGRMQTPEEERVHIEDASTGKILHWPPPAQELEQRMEKMLKMANQRYKGGNFIHPVVQAILLHFWLAYDHPFEDGNGRLARALFYWKMLRGNYPLFEFISISALLKKAPAQYRDAFLYTETDDNDLTYFLSHQLEIIHRAIRKLERYLKQKAKEIKELQSLLRRSICNHRQQAFLVHCIRHPNHEYLINAHARSHQVTYVTARKDLLDLVEKGLLRKVARDKRTSVFLSAPDLERRLRAL